MAPGTGWAGLGGAGIGTRRLALQRAGEAGAGRGLIGLRGRGIRLRRVGRATFSRTVQEIMWLNLWSAFKNKKKNFDELACSFH